MAQMIDMKHCPRCKHDLPRTEFNKNRSRKDGLRSECRSCQKIENKRFREKNPEYHAEWARNNPEKVKSKRARWYEKNGRDYYRRYYAKHPEKSKESSARWRRSNPEYRRKYYEANRERIRRIDKIWVDSNRDKVREKYRRYYQSRREEIVERKREFRRTPAWKAIKARAMHKRRSLEASVVNDLTAEQWEMILRKQKNRCVGCGERFTKDLPPTRDHIVPVSKGGGLTVTNVVALCRSCNSKKHVGEPEYVAQRGLL